MTNAQLVGRAHKLAAAGWPDGAAAQMPDQTPSQPPSHPPIKPGLMQSLPPAAGSFLLCWIAIFTLHHAEMFSGALQQSAASGDATPLSNHAIPATVLLAVLLPVLVLTGLNVLGRLKSAPLQGIAFGGVAGIVLAQIAALF